MRAYEIIMSFVLVAAVCDVFDIVIGRLGWPTKWGSIPVPVTQFAVALVVLGVLLDPRPLPLVSKLFVILLAAVTLFLAHKPGG